MSDKKLNQKTDKKVYRGMLYKEDSKIEVKEEKLSTLESTKEEIKVEAAEESKKELKVKAKTVMPKVVEHAVQNLNYIEPEECKHTKIVKTKAKGYVCASCNEPIVEHVISSKYKFGRGKVVASELKVLDKPDEIKGKVLGTLSKDDKFYFDTVYVSNIGNTYVSWNGRYGLKYVLYKSNEKSNVVEISG